MTCNRQPKKRMRVLQCLVPGCERPGRYVLGYCMAHYERLKKYGDPNGGGCLKGEPLRFLEAAIGHTGGECLTWPFARLSNGYASANIDGRTVIVSRYVTEQRRGSPPTSRHEAAHICGNGHLGCINPEHLVWKTPAENQADRVAHGTSNRGERQWNAKLTAEAVRSIRRVGGTLTQQDLADIHGVSPTAIASVLKGRSWGWLDDYSNNMEIAA